MNIDESEVIENFMNDMIETINTSHIIYYPRVVEDLTHKIRKEIDKCIETIEQYGPAEPPTMPFEPESNSEKELYSSHLHAFVQIKYNDRMIKIDKHIAPLIKEIWNAGIVTTNSCESNNSCDYIWIEFGSGYDFDHFTDIVFNGAEKDKILANRIYGYNNKYIPGHWIYRVLPVYDEDTNKHIMTCIQLRFPRFDYNYVYKK